MTTKRVKKKAYDPVTAYLGRDLTPAEKAMVRSDPTDAEVAEWMAVDAESDEGATARRKRTPAKTDDTDTVVKMLPWLALDPDKTPASQYAAACRQELKRALNECPELADEIDQQRAAKIMSETARNLRALLTAWATGNPGKGPVREAAKQAHDWAKKVLRGVVVEPIQGGGVSIDLGNPVIEINDAAGNDRDWLILWQQAAVLSVCKSGADHNVRHFVGVCPRCHKIFEKRRTDQLYDRPTCRIATSKNK